MRKGRPRTIDHRAPFDSEVRVRDSPVESDMPRRLPIGHDRFAPDARWVILAATDPKQGA
ncbi:hypothetical protein GCM10009633_00970 [Janibacter melonis]